MNEREVQFHGALLDLGHVPNVRFAIDFGGMMCTTTERHATSAVYKAHKELLLVHLENADYFDVYYLVPGGRDDPNVHKQLTEKAALWIGEFYRWMMEQQLDQYLAD